MNICKLFGFKFMSCSLPGSPVHRTRTIICIVFSCAMSLAAIEPAQSRRRGSDRRVPRFTKQRSEQITCGHAASHAANHAASVSYLLWIQHPQGCTGLYHGLWIKGIATGQLHIQSFWTFWSWMCANEWSCNVMHIHAPSCHNAGLKHEERGGTSGRVTTPQVESFHMLFGPQISQLPGLLSIKPLLTQQHINCLTNLVKVSTV